VKPTMPSRTFYKSTIGRLDKREGTAVSLRRTEGSVDTYETRIRAASKESRLYGDVGMRLRDIGGAVSLVGGAKAQQAFFAGNELLQAAEGLRADQGRTARLE